MFSYFQTRNWHFQSTLLFLQLRNHSDGSPEGDEFNWLASGRGRCNSELDWRSNQNHENGIQLSSVEGNRKRTPPVVEPVYNTFLSSNVTHCNSFLSFVIEIHDNLPCLPPDLPATCRESDSLTCKDVEVRWTLVAPALVVLFFFILIPHQSNIVTITPFSLAHSLGLLPSPTPPPVSHTNKIHG